MATASFVGLLRTILIIVLIWYGIRLLIKYLGPYLIKRQMNKFNQQAGRNQQTVNERQEGEVFIKSRPTAKSSQSDDEGEYIDFEEVE